MNGEAPTAEEPKKKKSRKKLWIVLASVALFLSLLVGACALYLGDYYKADRAAIDAFAPMNEVTFHTEKNGNVIFEAEGARVGLIFYPGGKVETEAYMPLMAAFARRGIFCVLIDMPFRLAVFDIDAADGIPARYPQIENWYIGGHSLGGAMAASYLAEHQSEFEGLLLLAAYSSADLSQSNLAVLSVYGTEDKVMNRQKYEKNKKNLPENFREVIIDGGCHAYFGMYGAQDGDGTPTVTNKEQIMASADAMAAMVAEAID